MSDTEVKEGVLVGSSYETFKFSVEVSKNSKGYNWTIKVRDDSDEVIKQKLAELDAYCEEKWGEKK